MYPHLSRVFGRIFRTLGFRRFSWNEQYRAGLWQGEARSATTIRMIEDLCHGGKMVEFGCGEGELPVILSPNTFREYLGIDISDVAIARARQRAAAAGLTSCSFEQGDMSTWRGSSEVDFILLEECLYYLNERCRLAFLAKCSVSLAAKGRILVVVHSKTKHGSTLQSCREVCQTISEVMVGSRCYLVCSRRTS